MTTKPASRERVLEKNQVKVATTADVIAQLQKMPPDAPVYFDCPNCGKANGFNHLGIAAMVTTKESND